MNGAAAAAAAARKRREEQEREEEQETTPMAAEDGYEYKILRSNWASFKHAASLQSVLQYEAEAGWDLFEKLDNNRLRLRRPVQCREQDAQRTQDPYRIWVGPSENATALLVVAVLFGVIALVMTFAIAFH